MVIVQADTEFGTIELLEAVRKRSWRAVVGMRCNRKISDGRRLKQLYHHGKRGQQVQLEGMTQPLSGFKVSGSNGLRASVNSTLSFPPIPILGLIWCDCDASDLAIEGFFKTIKHRFGLHCFGQSTKLGVYRWLILSLRSLLTRALDLTMVVPPGTRLESCQ